jgi:hypothetical protein
MLSDSWPNREDHLEGLRIRAAFGKSAAAPSLRFDRDAGRAPHDAIRVAELHENAVGLRKDAAAAELDEDAVVRGIERYAAARGREDRKGRRRVGVD